MRPPPPCCRSRAPSLTGTLVQAKLQSGEVPMEDSILTLHEIAYCFCALLQLDFVALQVPSP